MPFLYQKFIPVLVEEEADARDRESRSETQHLTYDKVEIDELNRGNRLERLVVVLPACKRAQVGVERYA